MEKLKNNFVCREFLQSDVWKNFQSSFGVKNYNVSSEKFWANILEYKLPIVGNYLYIPRGPVLEYGINEIELSSNLEELLKIAKENKIGWIRIDCNDDKIENILKNKSIKIVKAPHDMQPKQVFIINLVKSEEEILAQMKPKTRYNIKLAIKKGVKIEIIKDLNKETEKVDEFLDLIQRTGDRKGVNFYPKNYYKKMLENISGNNLTLYVASYRGRVIAGALLVLYEKVAIYLHGASSDNNRDVMAPHLLQWQMIVDAKDRGALKYDFGGVSIGDTDKEREKKWQGVTRFKQGFSKDARPVEFSGSYDIILNPAKYWIYRFIQKIKEVL